MKKQVFSVLAAGALMLSVAGTASADKGGNPNANACFGQGTSFGASSVTLPNGERATPRNRADLFFGGSVKDTQSVTRAQFAGVENCPF